MLKKAIAVTAVLILITFGIMTCILLQPNGWTLFASNKNKGIGDGVMTVYYRNALMGAEAKQITQDVPLFFNPETERNETRVKQTALLNANEIQFTREGWAFDGWRLNTDETSISDGFIPAGLSEDDGFVIFIATWARKEYIVSFLPDYPNGDVIGPIARRVTFGMPIDGLNSIQNSKGETFAPNVLTYGTLKFLGWRSESEGRGTLITATTEYNFPRNTILYGWWGATNVNPTNPAAETCRASVSSQIQGTTSVGPFTAYSQTFTKGGALKFTLAAFDKFQSSGYKLESIKIGADVIAKSWFSNQGEYVTKAYSTDISVIVIYSTATTPQVQTYTAIFASAVKDNPAAAGPSLGGDTLYYNAGDKVNLPLGMFQNKTGFTFLYLYINTTKIEPQHFTETINGFTNVYQTNALYFNINVTAYYSINSATTNPTNPTPAAETFTATFTTAIKDFPSAVAPTLGVSSLVFKSGDKINLPIGMFQDKTGFTFLYLMINNAKIEPQHFTDIVDGYRNVFQTNALSFNVKITAYYTVAASNNNKNNIAATKITLTLKYASSNGKNVPLKNETRSFMSDEEQKFWLYDINDGFDFGVRGFDTFQSYNLTFDYFQVQIGTQVLKFYQKDLSKSGTNYYLSCRIDQNYTITVYYK
jgi:hypothetical protein